MDAINALLLNAAKSGDLKALKNALRNRVDIDTRHFKGKTPAMIAAYENQANCLAQLIEGGCDLEARDDSQLNALMSAAMNGSLDCIKLLIAAGCDIHVRDSQRHVAVDVGGNLRI